MALIDKKLLKAWATDAKRAELEAESKAKSQELQTVTDSLQAVRDEGGTLEKIKAHLEQDIRVLQSSKDTIEREIYILKGDAQALSVYVVKQQQETIKKQETIVYLTNMIRSQERLLDEVHTKKLQAEKGLEEDTARYQKEIQKFKDVLAEVTDELRVKREGIAGLDKKTDKLKKKWEEVEAESAKIAKKRAEIASKEVFAEEYLRRAEKAYKRKK